MTDSEHIEELENILTQKDAQIKELEDLLAKERSVNARVIARNARLDYDLGCAYQLIDKLKGDHYV